MTSAVRTVGLDVSDKFTTYCLLGSDGEVEEEGRIRTTPQAFTERFSTGDFRFVLEAGTHSPWISRLLGKGEREVIVANPRRVELISKATRKNDRADAETLARLGRMDAVLLSPVRHRSAEAQADLAAIRARAALISSRTLLINHTRGAAKAMGVRLPACDAHSFHKYVGEELPPELVMALTPLLSAIAKLTEEIKAFDRLVLWLIEERYTEARVLQQVAGVGPLIALTFILTIGDPHRFKKSRELGPYLGLIPRQHESGESSPALRISKAGDHYLRQLLVNGAHYVLGHYGPDSDLRRWGLQRTLGGKNAKKRAVVAVARRLAILLHRLWVTGEVYEPLHTSRASA